MPIQISIITPERVVYKDTIDSASLPTTLGEITVLPHHLPLIALLTTGVITLKKGTEEIHMASSGGFVEILPKSHLRILADTAERADELSLHAVETARAKAQEVLARVRYADESGHAAALGTLERELARLKVLRKSGAHHRSHNLINQGEEGNL